jgi:beta-N-acetylhexosaminidase
MTDINKAINNLMAGMSVEEKVGQVMATHFDLDKLKDPGELEELTEHIVNFHVGNAGIYGFGSSTVDTAEYINGLQRLAKLPLMFISTMEAGVGSRFTDATRLPQNMALGAGRKPELSYAKGKALISEARAIGIPFVFIPSVDVNYEPNNPIINIRAFSDDPELVAAMGTAQVRGIQENGGLACAKHFPGHGRTDRDTHLELETLEVSRQELVETDLVPFKAVIDAGVAAIMSAHIAVPALDDGKIIPATLSKNILTGLLRKDLGFDGIIVTDAMRMEAISKYYKHDEAAVLAFQAGADLILADDVPLSINGLLKAIKNGDISIERLDASVRKMLAATMKQGLFENRFVDVPAVLSKLKTPNAVETAKEIAENAVTLVRNEGGSVPLSPDKIKKASFLVIADEAEWDDAEVFAKEIRKTTPEADIILWQGETESGIVDSIAAKTAKGAPLVCAVYAQMRPFKGDSSFSDTGEAIIRKATEGRDDVILISFGNPYILTDLPHVAAYIATFDPAPVSQIAAKDVLTGDLTPTGKLPITIPGLYPIHHGL